MKPSNPTTPSWKSKARWPKLSSLVHTIPSPTAPAVLYSSGCASVIALPSPVAPLRVLLKVLFTGLSDTQWTAYSAAVYSLMNPRHGAQLAQAERCGDNLLHGCLRRGSGEMTEWWYSYPGG